MEQKFSYRIANDSGKEHVFVEILYEGELWAEISQENNTLTVVFFSPNNAKYWEFKFDEAMAVLEQAKKALLGE